MIAETVELPHDGVSRRGTGQISMGDLLKSSIKSFASAPGDAPANKGEQHPPEPLTRAEVDALLAACSAISRNGIRNRALIVVMARAGLRLAEALALKPADVDPQAGSIRILRGKGRKARTVGMPPDAMAVVQRWVDLYRQLGLRGQLFATAAGRPLTQNYVRNLLGRLADKAGITKRVHPHGLRHTMATDLARAGVPVNIISGQLGHSSSAVTARYIDHIAAHDVVTAMQGMRWS
jgi:integrase/recombinase XerD